MKHLFGTSESDSQTFYRDDSGKFFVKRYGLPVMECTKEFAKSQAWLEANRKGRFTHLMYTKPGEWIPSLSNTEAQQYIVSVMIGDINPYQKKAIA